MIWHDFDEIPHMTVAGATRWGKTIFLKVLLTYLIEQHGDDVEFYIFDLKGGLAFNKFKSLKQVRGVAGDYKESSDLMDLITSDIKRDMSDFKLNDIENITDTDLPKRKFVIIDEAGELMKNKSMTDQEKKWVENCQRTMSYIARVSGGIGLRQIFCTQYPTGDVLDRQIKANSSAKISFRLENGTMSKVALDELGAEEIDTKGRAIYRTVDRHLVQVPYISREEMWSRLEEHVDVKAPAENGKGRENPIKFR
nr:FtsK/SpoIIIE domain-containing protein [Pontibacillus sp. HN14]